MKLNELLTKLKTILMIDNIRAYIYEDNHIDIIDYEPAFNDGNTEIHESSPLSLKLNIDNKKIIAIDHNFIIFTSANKEAVSAIIELIGIEIGDLDDYCKIEKFENQIYQTV